MTFYYILVYLLGGVLCCICDCKGNTKPEFELTIARALISLVLWPLLFTAAFLWGAAIAFGKLGRFVIWRKK